MVSDYTPSAAVVCTEYAVGVHASNNVIFGTSPLLEEETRAEFFRWLNRVRAEAWDEGYDARASEREPRGVLDIIESKDNPYWSTNE